MIDLDTILNGRAAGVLAGMVASALSIATQFREHTKWTATTSFIAGVFVAFIAVEPTIEYFNLSSKWAGVIGAVCGISGRNIVVWISRASKDPTGIISAILKLGKK